MVEKAKADAARSLQEARHETPTAGEHAAAVEPFSPFWLLVPEDRPLMPEDGGTEPVGRLDANTWYLAMEARGSALVVQNQYGKRGLLKDTSRIQRA